MTALEDILLSFAGMEPADRLEWLVEFGNSLPALPVAYHADRDAGNNIVHECQAPVYLRIEVLEGALILLADVPREAPVARGFVSILKTAFDGTSPAELEQAPADFLSALSIKALLGMQRQRGLAAIYQKLKMAMES